MRFDAVDDLRGVGMPGSAELLRIPKESAFVLTDTEEFESELTVMNVPCLIMRLTSCRPSTILSGKPMAGA